MKHELPIAIVLLALGCLPWIWQASETGEVNAATVQASSSVAPWQKETKQGQPAQLSALATSSIPAREFLFQTASAFRDGDSVFGDIEIDNDLLSDGKPIAGRFWCRGMGSKQSRLELILGVDNSAKMTQVCDGRFVYRLMQQNNEREFRFFNLEKLNNEDSGIVQSTLPATWVGDGSIDGLFLNLADAFNFGAIKLSGDQQQVEITGTWNPHHLAKLMLNWIDHRELLPKPDWSKLPPHFPHGARLRFAASTDRWHPTEILFFQFDAENNDQPKPVISVNFGRIKTQSMSSELFQIDPNESGAIDETELYNERINLLNGKQRIASEPGDAVR